MVTVSKFSALSPQGRIVIKAGRERPLHGGNPWIFSEAIARVEPENLPAGSPAEIFSAAARKLGLGCYNSRTTIAVRMLAWGDAFDPGRLIERRLAAAIEMRSRLIGEDTDSYRLVNGDGDGLSGVVIDRYGDVLVAQFLTAGADRLREAIVESLTRLLAPRAIYERSHGAVRREEGLEDRSTLLYGDPPAEIVAIEDGLRFHLDPLRGQKTGLFLDQRENRVRFGRLARGARVLDAFCYSGAFSLNALRAGARSVTAIDSSAPALEWAQRNLELNGSAAGAVELLRADSPRYLAECREKFDLIVLDPPPLARSRKDALHAARLYSELNAMAIRLLSPGGHLMTFSCSAHLHGPAFVRAVRIAQLKSSRQMHTLAHLGAGADHPVLLGHPEGEYLTGLLLGDLR